MQGMNIMLQRLPRLGPEQQVTTPDDDEGYKLLYCVLVLCKTPLKIRGPCQLRLPVIPLSASPHHASLPHLIAAAGQEKKKKKKSINRVETFLVADSILFKTLQPPLVSCSLRSDWSRRRWALVCDRLPPLSWSPFLLRSSPPRPSYTMVSHYLICCLLLSSFTFRRTYSSTLLVYILQSKEDLCHGLLEGGPAFASKASARGRPKITTY